MGLSLTLCFCFPVKVSILGETTEFGPTQYDVEARSYKFYFWCSLSIYAFILIICLVVITFMKVRTRKSFDRHSENIFLFSEKHRFFTLAQKVIKNMITA